VSQVIADSLIERVRPAEAGALLGRTPAEPRWQRCRAYHLAVRGFAILLLLAAGLKAEALLSALADPPALYGWASTGKWAEVAVEWLVASWLLAGVAPFWARRATLVLLTVFVGVSGWRLVAGETDCGCFGRVIIHPRWTLALDAVSLLVFLTVRPAPFGGHRDGGIGRLGLIGFFCASLGAPALALRMAAWSVDHTSPVSTVVFDPGSAKGKTFVLLPLLDDSSSADLSTGRQVVILYDHNCERCRGYLRRRSIAAEAGEIRSIDIGEASVAGASMFRSPFKAARLKGNVECIADVPAEVVLQQGIVTSVVCPR
jgi:hypothetical protein